MHRQSPERIRRDGDLACPDRHVHVADADDIDEQGNGQNGAAAAKQPEAEADETAAQCRQDVLDEV
ncbi:hypothetical protein D3C73_1640010 [compost metagenome]